jgi:hypothetical protein
MPRSPWSSEKIGLVRKLIRQGANLNQVAAALGAKDSKSISSSLRKYGILHERAPQPKRGPMSEEEKRRRSDAMARYYQRKELENDTRDISEMA